MRLLRFVTLALLTAVAGAAPARAGTYSITPTSSTITLGQSVTFAVSMDSADPSPPFVDGLSLAATNFTASGPSSVHVTNFQLAAGLPFQTLFGGTDPTTGTANFIFGNNSFSSFVGNLYTFDFTPTATGTYTFAGADNASAFYLSQNTDGLTLTSLATVDVLPQNPVPEPAGFVLTTVVCGGLAFRRFTRTSARIGKSKTAKRSAKGL
jgi:hypothetical protein